MNSLTEHLDSFKQALQDQNVTDILREKAWLTTAAASTLLQQDAKAMHRVRACCADLSALADHFDATGKPGDHWRALGDVLTVALASSKPQVQLRLACLPR